MDYLGSDIKANAGVAAIRQASEKFSAFAQNPTHVVVDLFGVFHAATDGMPNDPQIQLKASQNGSTATLSRYANRLEISPSDAFQVSVGAVAIPDLCVATNHDVGIGTGAPDNRLQIGSLGSWATAATTSRSATPGRRRASPNSRITSSGVRLPTWR